MPRPGPAGPGRHFVRGPARDVPGQPGPPEQVRLPGLGRENISAEAIIESPTTSHPTFTACKVNTITVNGKTFSSLSPTGLDVGEYVPTALSDGSFSTVPQ